VGFSERHVGGKAGSRGGVAGVLHTLILPALSSKAGMVPETIV